MQLLGGPMSLNQLKDWSKTVDTWTQSNCAAAMLQLDRSDPHEPRRIYFRREG